MSTGWEKLVPNPWPPLYVDTTSGTLAAQPRLLGNSRFPMPAAVPRPANARFDDAPTAQTFTTAIYTPWPWPRGG